MAASSHEEVEASVTLSSEEQALFNGAREALEGCGKPWFKRFNHRASVNDILKRMRQPVGTPTRIKGMLDLMIALFLIEDVNPEGSLGEIIRQIKTALEGAALAASLVPVNRGTYQHLFETLLNRRQAFYDILGVVPTNYRGCLLSQVTAHGYNALMLAATNQPEAVAPLLAAMAEFPAAAREAIVSQVDADGWNALMCAARYQPEAVAPLLAAMAEFPAAAREAIVSQVDADGRNALMLAEHYQPSIAADIRNAMESITTPSEASSSASSTALGLSDMQRAQVTQKIHDLTGLFIHDVKGTPGSFMVALTLSEEDFRRYSSLFVNNFQNVKISSDSSTGHRHVKLQSLALQALLALEKEPAAIESATAASSTSSTPSRPEEETACDIDNDEQQESNNGKLGALTSQSIFAHQEAPEAQEKPVGGRPSSSAVLQI